MMMKSVKKVDLVLPIFRDFIICTRWHSNKQHKYWHIRNHNFLDRADFSTLIDPINAFLCSFGITTSPSFSLSSKTFKCFISEAVISPVFPKTIGSMTYV